MKALPVFIIFILFLLLTVNTRFAFAATQSLSINNIPLTVDQSQEFETGVNFLCPGCTSDSYLRGVFYPSGTSYFGFTQDNNGNWSNAAAGSCTTYFKIAQSDLTKDGTWSGTLKVKPDKDSSYYNGPGEYLFKVGRYTPSCGSPLWSSETTIAITGPTPTPTQTPTSTPTTTPTPTEKPSNTPTPIKSSPTPTKKISPTPTPKTSNSQSSSSGVLGAKTKNNPTKEPKRVRVEVLSATDNAMLPKILIGIGVVFFLLCVIVFFYPTILDKIKKNNNE